MDPIRVRPSELRCTRVFDLIDELQCQIEHLKELQLRISGARNIDQLVEAVELYENERTTV